MFAIQTKSFIIFYQSLIFGIWYLFIEAFGIVIIAIFNIKFQVLVQKSITSFKNIRNHDLTGAYRIGLNIWGDYLSIS